jgi:putative acetyltransferase
MDKPALPDRTSEYSGQQIVIRAESPADFAGIDEVNRLAFAGHEEGDVVRRLRDAGMIIASLVATKDMDVVGHVLFSRLPIETHSGTVAAVALGPLAVRPEYQKAGLGSALIREGLEVCRRHGESIVIVGRSPRVLPALRLLRGAGETPARPILRRGVDGTRADARRSVRA